MVGTVCRIDGAEGRESVLKKDHHKRSYDMKHDKIVKDILANFLFVLAVKVIKQALCIVAELITLAVVEEPPAARVCAVCPGVHSQRAVTSIPAAGE